MLLDVIKISAKENFTLQNEHFFKRATVGYGTVTWSDELDIAPETLYYESTPI